jgi:hypothetical protein
LCWLCLVFILILNKLKNSYQHLLTLFKEGRWEKWYIYIQILVGNPQTIIRSVNRIHTASLEEQYHNSKNAHFELCPHEVCLRPYLPSGIASHVYFLKWPWQGRSVVLLMWWHRPRQWFVRSPEKLYFSSCDSVLIGVWYVEHGWKLISWRVTALCQLIKYLYKQHYPAIKHYQQMLIMHHSGKQSFQHFLHILFDLVFIHLKNHWLSYTPTQLCNNSPSASTKLQRK